jgi:hypothetical protein
MGHRQRRRFQPAEYVVDVAGISVDQCRLAVLRAGGGCNALAAAVGASRWGTGNFGRLCPAVVLTSKPTGSAVDVAHATSADPHTIEEDDMQAFIAVSASREAIVWPEGPATLLASPNDGSLMTAPPLNLEVVGSKADPLSELQMDAFLQRPA